MEYLGAWGTLIHEKNLKPKISCQTPFKGELQSIFPNVYLLYCMACTQYLLVLKWKP